MWGTPTARRRATLRLLRAELRKLRRPLVLWTAVAVVAIVGLFDWGLQRNAVEQGRSFAQGQGPIPTCAQVGLSPGPACDRQLGRIRASFCASEGVAPGPPCDRAIARTVKEERQANRQFRAQITASLRDVKAVQTPLGAGTMAAGMLASMVGAVALLLLAGGHVGQEWSGRTMKQVLTQEGRRWRVLAAKAISLWLVGVALLAVTWAALAVLGPILGAAYHVPGPGVSAGDALGMSLPPVARSLLVLAAFACLGTLSAAVTRNTLGSFFLAFAFVLVSLILAGFRAVGRYTLAYWVAGWMGFRSAGIVAGPLFLWRDSFFPLPEPTRLGGLAGLVGVIAASLGLAVLRVTRSDVTG